MTILYRHLWMPMPYPDYLRVACVYLLSESVLVVRKLITYVAKNVVLFIVVSWRRCTKLGEYYIAGHISILRAWLYVYIYLSEYNVSKKDIHDNVTLCDVYYIITQNTSDCPITVQSGWLVGMDFWPFVWYIWIKYDCCRLIDRSASESEQLSYIFFLSLL